MRPSNGECHVRSVLGRPHLQLARRGRGRITDLDSGTRPASGRRFRAGAGAGHRGRGPAVRPHPCLTERHSRGPLCHRTRRPASAAGSRATSSPHRRHVWGPRSPPTSWVVSRSSRTCALRSTRRLGARAVCASSSARRASASPPWRGRSLPKPRCERCRCCRDGPRIHRPRLPTARSRRRSHPPCAVQWCAIPTCSVRSAPPWDVSCRSGGWTTHPSTGSSPSPRASSGSCERPAVVAVACSCSRTCTGPTPRRSRSSSTWRTTSGPNRCCASSRSARTDNRQASTSRRLCTRDVSHRCYNSRRSTRLR